MRRKLYRQSRKNRIRKELASNVGGSGRFLDERCIPRQRAGLREYLEAKGLDEYDPLAIIQKTKGRMAEDDQWMEVREIR